VKLTFIIAINRFVSSVNFRNRADKALTEKSSERRALDTGRYLKTVHIIEIVSIEKMLQQRVPPSTPSGYDTVHNGAIQKIRVKFLDNLGPLPPPCVNLCHFLVPLPAKYVSIYQTPPPLGDKQVCMKYN
jgi:hypothetical protein